MGDFRSEPLDYVEDIYFSNEYNRSFRVLPTAVIRAKS